MPIRFVCPVCWTVREDVDDSLLGKTIKCNDCHAMSVATHTPEPNAEKQLPPPRMPVPPAAQPETISLAPIIPWSEPSFPVPQLQSPRMLLSTGDIPQKYEIIDLVFTHGSSSDGALKGLEPSQAFQILADWLGQTAQRAGADAVIHIRFDFQFAQGFVGRAFEVFAYGTAVRIQ